MTDDTDTCPATNSDGDPCGLAAGWGTDNDSGPCKFHGGAGGTNADGSSHAGNDNATRHGAFSEHFRADLTDDENEAIDKMITHLAGIDDERTIAAEIAAEALMKYKRSADSRFLQEARQWFDDFNLLPNADEIDATIGGDGANPLNVMVERSAHDDAK